VTYGTGFIPDRGPDLLGRARSAARRKEVLARLSSLPDEEILAPWRKAAQGGYQACLPFGVRQAVHAWRAHRNLPDPDLSAWFGYYYGRRRRNILIKAVRDEGTSPRAMVVAAEKHGFCLAEDWGPKHPGWGINAQPSDVAHFQAQRCLIELIPIYATGREIADRIADSIHLGQPCIVALPVDSAFQRNTQPPVIGPPTGSTDGLLHAMCVIGHRLRSDGRRDCWTANSWNDDWAQGGCAWLSPDYIEMATWVAFLRSVREVSAA
jgi:hypothetical protein